jgi:ribosomal protein S26
VRPETKQESSEKKRKAILDAIIRSMVQAIDRFREYDKKKIIEDDPYIINKILKLCVNEDVHFNTFSEFLEEIAFVTDI